MTKSSSVARFVRHFFSSVEKFLGIDACHPLYIRTPPPEANLEIAAAMKNIKLLFASSSSHHTNVSKRTLPASPPSPRHSFDSSSSPPPSILPSPPQSPSSVLSYSQFMEETIAALQPLISKWAATPSHDSFQSLFTNSEEAETFLLAVQDLQTAMKNLISANPSALETLVRGQQLLQSAMDWLQKEFFYLLKSNRRYLRPESLSNRLSTTARLSTPDVSSSSPLSVTLSISDSDDEEIETPEAGRSFRVMNELKMIADCMIGSGYGKECVFVYNITRKSVVDEALYEIGLDRSGRTSSSSSPVYNRRRRTNWEAVEPKIRRWLNAVEYAVKTIFKGERILCDHVFSSSAAIQESCFSEVTRDGAMALFAFSKEIAADKKLWKKSPERVFPVLDIYDAIANLGLDIISVFNFDSTSAIRSEAESSLHLLGGAVKSMLRDLESAIEGDRSKAEAPGGGLHPLVRYVINFLVYLADYERALSEILADWPLPAHRACLPEGSIEATGSEDGLISTSNVSDRLAWLILVLICKMDGKAERYGDVALSYLFMADNLKYAVGKVRSSNLRRILGEGWLSTHEAKVRQYGANYVRVEWSKVVSALNGGCGATTTDEMSVKQAMECLERFNAAFYEACHREREWVVADRELREEIREAVARMVVPAYRKMYDKYGGRLAAVEDEEGGVGRVIRLAPEDVEKQLSELPSGAVSGDGSSGGRSGGSASPTWSGQASPCGNA